MPKAEDTRPDPTATDVVEPMLAMARRRGYIQPAYELYGGTAGFYDYGPLGAALKLNFENLWRRHYVLEEGCVEIHCPTIAPEQVFRASGHLANFADVVIECKACGHGHRFDHFIADETDRLATEVEKAKVPDAAKQEALAHLAQVKEEVATVTDPKVAAGFVKSPFVTADKYKGELRCQNCQASDLAAPTAFNLMFKTNVGPGSSRAGYMRPETAQGMFVNFDWIYRYFREKLPFGAVQLGKAFRNEIAPRQALIRLREFHQAELEYFCDPDQKDHPRFGEVADLELPLVPNEGEPGTWRLGDAVEKGVIANQTIAYFVAKTYRILTDAGLKPDRIRFRQHLKDEMAHYAADCWDAEYHSARYGWIECVGIADRGCYDLESHAKVSGSQLAAFRRFDEPIEREVTRVTADMKKLGPVFKGEAKDVGEAVASLTSLPASGTVTVSVNGRDVEVPVDALTLEQVTERVTGEHVVPHVVEPSYGVDRILFAVLEHSYDESGEWAVLRLPPEVAPIKCGVFPLVSKDGLPEIAQRLDRELRAEGLVTYYDDGGSIGRRYARMDEAGTPFCVTIDHDTRDTGVCTIRERDTQGQVTVPLTDAVETIRALVRGRTAFSDLA